MKIKTTLTLIFGIIHNSLAIITTLFALAFYFNILDTQVLWNIPQENTIFYSTLLFITALYFTTSGTLLIYEWKRKTI
ncbi:MAG: hypothetical protein QXU99_00920 [Candidatus Bathyarchaeia archaeon]